MRLSHQSELCLIPDFCFLEIGPGWDIAFAPDFAEFTFYRLSELSLSDKRKYWFGGTAGRYYPANDEILSGKVPYLPVLALVYNSESHLIKDC